MSKQNVVILMAVVITVLQSGCSAVKTLSFHSDGYEVFINANNGLITKICNTETGKEYSIVADDCLIETDQETIKFSRPLTKHCPFA